MLGILCGLESEAVIARRIPNVIVACAAARPHKARELARELVAKGATRLMSFGVAGALSPTLPLGGLVIGTHVTSRIGTWACDSTWGDVLAAQNPHSQRGGIWGSETLVPTGREKRALHDQSGCIAVDMESQCAAEVAAEAKLPLAVLRTICDHADMDVPPVVMASIKEDGSIDYRRGLSHLLRAPWQILDLIHVGHGMGRATTKLQPCRSVEP